MEDFVTQRSPGDCVGGAEKKEEERRRINNEAKSKNSESDQADRTESVESALGNQPAKEKNNERREDGRVSDVPPPVIVISRADAEYVQKDGEAKGNVYGGKASEEDEDQRQATRRKNGDESEEDANRASGIEEEGEAADHDKSKKTPNDSFLPEELSMISIERRPDPEELEEADWSLITQWSSRDRGSDSDDANEGDGEVWPRRGSPVEGNGQRASSSTYTKFGDEITFDSPPLTPREVVDIKYDSSTPLDPISERDESDDEGEAASEGGPSKMKLKLSTAMNDLLTIGQDDSTADDSVRSDAAEIAGAEEGKEEGDTDVDEEESGSSSESEDEGKDEKDIEKDDRKTPAEEAGKQAGGETQEEGPKRRTKRGRITKKKKASPIHLSGALRTFSNPISYLGGPNIEYEEVKEGRERQDSVTSITSLD